MSKRFLIFYILIGDILRENVKNEIEFGKKVKEYMDKGFLVLDEIVIEIVKDRILKEDCKNGFLFDGFLCIIVQVEVFDKVF